MSQTRTIRPREERDRCKNVFYEWLILNRNRPIPAEEVDKKIRETTKDLALPSILKRIGYVDVRNGHVYVADHFRNNEILREQIKTCKRIMDQSRNKKKKEAKLMVKPSDLNGDYNVGLADIKIMLEKIMKHLYMQ